MIKILTILFILFILLGPKPQASASEKPVINEFMAEPPDGSNEWVEIYSQDTSDLSSYYLKDGAKPPKFLTNLQNCGNYYIWEYPSGDGWLNNDSDESIFLYNSEDVVIDSYENWNSPGENKTLARYPNHSGSFQQPQNATKCAENSAPQPTPNPTATPAATSTPEPTSSPNPIATPNPDSSPTSASPSTKKSSPSPQILGETSMQEATPSPESSPDSKFKLGGESKTKAAAIITGSGLVLIGISVGFYFWYNKISKSEKEQDSDDEQHLQ